MGEKISGIYQIKNKVTGMIYIGQSANVMRRKTEHFSNLRNGRHENPRLQNSYNIHGKDAFEWLIVELLESDKQLLTEREQYWHDQYPIEQRYSKKICVDSNLGVTFSDESRSKMSASKKKMSLATRSKMSVAKKKMWSENDVARSEHRAKMSAAAKGKIMSPETRAKLSAALKGRKLSQESIVKRTQVQQKPVLQIDKVNGRVIKEWDSATIVAKELKINGNNIGQCARGKRKSTGGFIWKYVEK